MPPNYEFATLHRGVVVIVEISILYLGAPLPVIACFPCKHFYSLTHTLLVTLVDRSSTLLRPFMTHLVPLSYVLLYQCDLVV